MSEQKKPRLTSKEKRALFAPEKHSLSAVEDFKILYKYGFTKPRLISQGPGRKVYSAVNDQKQSVVVKMILVPIVDFDEFMREVYMVKTLASNYPKQLAAANKVLLLPLRHGYTMLGVIVTPMATASLDKYFSQSMSSKELVQFVYQLFCSVDILHRLNLIHNDIKPENILVLDQKPLLTDFGLTLWGDPLFRRKTDELVTLPYRAPEMLCIQGTQELWPHAMSAPSDMWSLGMVLLELVWAKRERDLHHSFTGTRPLLELAHEFEGFSDEENFHVARTVKPFPLQILETCIPTLEKETREAARHVKEASASLADGIEIYNRVFKSDLDEKGLAPVEVLLLTLASHLLRILPQERWTAQRAMQFIQEFATKKLNIKSNSFHACPVPTKREQPGGSQIHSFQLLENALLTLKKMDKKELDKNVQDIQKSYWILIKDLKLTETKDQQAAFILATLFHWGGPEFLPWFLERYHEWGFTSLAELYAYMVKVYHLMVDHNVVLI